MTRKELKQLIKEVVSENYQNYQDFLDTHIQGLEGQKSSANAGAQRLVGKTIKTITLDPKDGYMKISFTDGTNFDFGEADGVYKFDKV